MSTAAGFAAKCDRMATVVPRSMREANVQAARAIKPLWYAEAGLRPGSVVAKRKASIRDTTIGRSTIVTLIAWQGPVHLVNGPTAEHVIAARGLATRGGARKRLVGSRASFGGSVRGAFAGSSSRSGKRAMTIAGNLRPYAFHPGTPGRHFWPANRQTALTVAPEIYKRSAVPSMIRQAGFGL